MKALLEGLRALGPARLAAMGAVALGMLGMLALMVLRGGTEPMALLCTATSTCATRPRSWTSSRAGTSRTGSPPTAARCWCRPRGGRGAPRAGSRRPAAGGSIGYEIFDRSDGLAATEFQQKINETRALEGELARTIRAMHGVRAVRVHLVLPRREPFARDRQDAQASVMLTTAGAGRLDREGSRRS